MCSRVDAYERSMVAPVGAPPLLMCAGPPAASSAGPIGHLFLGCVDTLSFSDLIAEESLLEVPPACGLVLDLSVVVPSVAPPPFFGLSL